MSSYAVSICILTSALSLAIGQVAWALLLSPYRNVPGPYLCKISRYVIIYHDLRLRRIEKIAEWHRKYGDVVLIAPGEVSFSNAALTREIYGSIGRHPKSQHFDNFLAYGERSIFCTRDVREHRKMLKRTHTFYQPATIYRPSLLQLVRNNVWKILHNLAKESEIHSTVDVLRWCNFFSFDNITELLYGPDLCARTIDNKTCVERTILAGWMEVEIWNNLLYNCPLTHKVIKTVISCCTPNFNFLSAEDRLADWNMDKINAARRNPEEMAVGSLLQVLHKAKNSDGEPFSKAWIAAELLDNMQAAHSTVALALTYILWNLACTPQWQEQIRKELSALPQEKDGLPTFDGIQAAPVLDACVRESGRLNPLTSGRAERVVPVTKKYNGVLLPAGTIVSTSTRSIHHRPDIFPCPQAYKPERWLEADEATFRLMESCYMPFGYGARLCLGKPFALVEIKLLVVGIMSEFEIGVDFTSGTTPWTMAQMGTQNALPRGQRCNLSLKKVNRQKAE